MRKDSSVSSSSHSPQGRRPQDPLPWKGIFLVIGLVFLTGVMYLVQSMGDYFMGSIVGQPSTLLSGYSCPTSDRAFAVSPVPQLFSYTKGNTEANRKEMLRINKKNHGLTAWYSYSRAFNEAGKAKLIDILAYETDPNQWVSRIYEEIKNDSSPHGSVDFVTKWLSPDNINLPTVFPYDNGLVVKAESGHSGYGNYASICTDVVAANGQKMRILYSIAHLSRLDLAEGQTVTAGTQIGLIGSTGNSTTPHAHITIQPDMIWDSNYRNLYNAGYNFYYSTSAAETLVKTIDPVAVMLNPNLAYSIVSDDGRRQALFANPAQYVASLGSVAFEGDLSQLGGASIFDTPAPRFDDFRISTTTSAVKVDEWIDVTVEALDQYGEVYSAYSENIDVVLSSSTASFDKVNRLSGGVTNFRVTDTVPGEVIIQVGNKGSIAEEKKVTFNDRLQYLEVTAPQKMTAGNSLAVVLRPIGMRGDVIVDQVTVASTVFPAVQSTQQLSIAGGRGEYTFSPTEEGIYELRFSTDTGIQEKVFITVESPVVDEVALVEEETASVDSPRESSDEGTEGSNDQLSEFSESGNSEENPKEEVTKTPELSENNTQTGNTTITFLEGDEYRIYDIDGMTTMVFNDANVVGEFPVEMRFTVPQGTEAVSIFTGLNDRNFPDTGELKLTKYTPGQEFIRYYPKYVAEDSYKKVVAYKNGAVLQEKVFTWSPASLHVFTDVIDGVTDSEIYQAVSLLKEAGVVKGNPDGSYGVDTPINRAATATILIRAFYADVNLDALAVTATPFSDVSASAWYASAIWFASQDSYEGESKPVILKGYQGKANPDGNVKIEEFVTMILRLLEVKVPETTPWYEGAIAKAIELGLMSESERQYIDQPLSRGLVARIMVKAMEVAQDLAEQGHLDAEVQEENSVLEEAPSTVVEDVSASPEVPVVTDPAPVSVEVNGLTAFALDGKLKLEWQSSYTGPFKLYRQEFQSSDEIFLGNSNGLNFTDVSVEKGKMYYYRVGVDGGSTALAEVLVSF